MRQTGSSIGTVRGLLAAERVGAVEADRTESNVHSQAYNQAVDLNPELLIYTDSPKTLN